MDPVFEEEQQHLSSTFAKLEAIEHELSAALRANLEDALEDKESMLDELALNADSDVHVETMAEYEAMNRIIDAYNLSAEINVEKLHRAQLLLKQPYFAKLQLQFRPGAQPKDVYIGAAGMTDDMRRHFIIDWRSPVAEVYYNQENGRTSYTADGRTIECELKLRRQFDIERDELKAYFDTTVAIQDPLLLQSLSKQRSDKLQAITTTIQKEQNAVIRHDDVPVLLVNGIAGSGKTSVLLQRIAYLFYTLRDTLRPKDVHLITPNPVFERYIDEVLPQMGESNPRTETWDALMEYLGLGSRGIGQDTSGEELAAIDEKLKDFELEPADFCDLRVETERVIGAAQARGAYNKLGRFPAGPRRCRLAADDLLERLNQRIKRLSADENVQDRLVDLSEEEQIRIFGRFIDAESDEEWQWFAQRYLQDRYAPVRDAIDNCEWLRIDRIGMRLLGRETLSSAEWLYLKLALAGGGDPQARYVMVDEVQDYTVAQLMVLARYFRNAHFLLLGDENQAIREHTANFAQVRRVFENAFGEVSELQLMTSYRSSPEITALFTTLLPDAQRVQAQSVQRPGTAPRIDTYTSKEAHAAALADAVAHAGEQGGLTAVIANDSSHAKHLAKQLGDAVIAADKVAALPQEGVLLLDLKLAKGLEFDRVIIADANTQAFPISDVARHRLYTAISRATQEVTILACGKLTKLLGR